MKKLYVTWIGLVSLFGCTAVSEAPRELQKTFVYDYQLPNQKQAQIWMKARNYIAQAYGDSNKVLQVQDEKNGLLMGKAIVAWPLFGGMESCGSNYGIRFAAKDNKARLELEILVGAISSCRGYPFPTQTGYNEVVKSFNETAQELEAVLESRDDFTNF